VGRVYDSVHGFGGAERRVRLSHVNHAQMRDD